MTARREGFTLVELMVALVVGGIVVAAGHQMLQATIDSAARSREEREPMLAAVNARLTLTEWLRLAFLPEDGGVFDGQHRVEVGVHDDQLTFTTGHGGTLYPGPHRIRLWVDRQIATPRRGLLAEVASLPVSRATAVDTLDLAPDASGLGIRYLIRVEARERWVNEWQSEFQLPIAVDLRVEGVSRVRLGGTDRNALSPVVTEPIVVRFTMENR